FRSIGVAILDGRDVAAADTAGAEPVVLVNDTLARRLVAGGNVSGQSLTFEVSDFNVPGSTRSWRIVGKVADVRDLGPRAAIEPEVYVSMQQGPPAVFEWIGRQAILAVRPMTGSAVSPAALRAAVQGVDARLPVFDMQTLSERFATAVSTERLLAAILTILGLTGFSLAGFGVFALVTHHVASRRREMAIRVVLGASPASVIHSVARDGVQLVVAGVGMGLLSAIWIDRALRSLTFGVRGLDPGVLVTAATAVFLTTTIAMWWPARRASRQEPTAVLRGD
ncbi:MAG TPA: FtsX-like permease family protein, partial [Vicinamibacterales bacterium]